MRSALSLAVLLAVPAFLGTSSVALAGSETPPHGPPWVRDFRAAHKDALARGVPIFVYLTKTH